MIMDNLDKRMSYSILSWDVMLFSNLTKLSSSHLIFPYKVHLVSISVGRLISKKNTISMFHQHIQWYWEQVEILFQR